MVVVVMDDLVTVYNFVRLALLVIRSHVLTKELLLIFLLISMELMITSPHLVSMVWLPELLVINDVLSVYWHQHVHSLHVPGAVGGCVLARLTFLQSLGGYFHP